MREIKFRGKRVDNGEWVEGSLFNKIKLDRKGNHIIETNIYVRFPERMDYFRFTGYIVYNEYYEVIPETVGQFTGLKDKNGKEIYEGDIIESNGIDGYCLWLVKFTEEPSSCVMGFICEPINREDISPVHNHVWYKGEIIDNIYDNPELLEKEGR